jgi:simple sugar transport system substrate-binding protein
MVAKGQPIKDGTNIPGLGVVHPDGHNLIVDQLVDLNEKTVDELAKSGL